MQLLKSFKTWHYILLASFVALVLGYLLRPLLEKGENVTGDFITTLEDFNRIKDSLILENNALKLDNEALQESQFWSQKKIKESQNKINDLINENEILIKKRMDDDSIINGLNAIGQFDKMSEYLKNK